MLTSNKLCIQNAFIFNIYPYHFDVYFCHTIQKLTNYNNECW